MDDEFAAFSTSVTTSPMPTAPPSAPCPRGGAAIEAGAARHARPWQISTVDWVDDVEERRALFAELADAAPTRSPWSPASYARFTAAPASTPGRASGCWSSPRIFRRASTPGAARKTGCEIRPSSGRRTELDRRDLDAGLSGSDCIVPLLTGPTAPRRSEWSARPRERSVPPVVDASQSFGAMPMDSA